MRFYLPTDIYVEKNCIANHKKDILALGSKAFIVTGRHSAKANGSLDDVLSVLKEGNVAYEIFDQVEENPSVETVAKASAQGKAFGADYVIGIGGGSPMDASKAIALLMANPQESEECLYQTKDLKYLPLLTIPTTCGTGSEATPVSVLTNHQKGIKKSIPYKIYPTLSLVDGKYLAFAKKSLIISTAVDALAHDIEAFLSSKANKYNRVFSEASFRIWAENKEALLSDQPLTEEQYENLMLASTLAGMAITHAGTGIPHGISYDLTYDHNVPHGIACGYTLAAFMRVCSKHVPEDVEKVLSLLEMKDLEDFATLIKSLIGEYTLSPEDKEAYCNKMAHNEGKLSAAPCPVTPEDVEEIFKESFLVK